MLKPVEPCRLHYQNSLSARTLVVLTVQDQMYYGTAWPDPFFSCIEVGKGSIFTHGRISLLTLLCYMSTLLYLYWNFLKYYLNTYYCDTFDQSLIETTMVRLTPKREKNCCLISSTKHHQLSWLNFYVITVLKSWIGKSSTFQTAIRLTWMTVIKGWIRGYIYIANHSP